MSKSIRYAIAVYVDDENKRLITPFHKNVATARNFAADRDIVNYSIIQMTQKRGDIEGRTVYTSNPRFGTVAITK